MNDVQSCSDSDGDRNRHDIDRGETFGVGVDDAGCDDHDDMVAVVDCGGGGGDSVAEEY